MRERWARRGGRDQGGVRLLLDTADGLDLRGLGVRAKLPEVLVLSAVAVTLHDVLVATVTGELVAHKTVEDRQTNRHTDREEKRETNRHT